MGWFKKFGSSRWWFGENSMYAQALDTAGQKGLTFGEFSLQPQANVGITNDQYVKLGILAGFIWLVTRK